MTKRLLITRPEHDDTTHYLSNWSKEAIEKAQAKGIKVFDLHKKRANKTEVVSMLSKQKPGLVIFNGHGGNNFIGGNKKEPLIVAGKNEHLLREKITYAVSCKSAKTLGPKSIDSGANAYIGYDDDFVFFYNPHMMTHPLKDDTAKLFLEPSNELVISLIKGNTTKECCKRSKQSFQTNMKRLLSSEATKEETSMARYLWWDMKHQVCLGDEGATF